MREWSNPFNPFNSMKVLLWKEHLEACARGQYLPPVTVDIDPVNACNLDCVYCNAFDAMNAHSEMKCLPEGHLLRIADFMAEWRDEEKHGPYSACVAGGGEPLLNQGTMALLERMHDHSLEAGLITNGTLLGEEKIKIIARTCRWVGVSVDAATPTTYNKLKGVKEKGLYDKVIENIQSLVHEVDKAKSNCRIAFKYLIHPWNVHEIYTAVLIARRLGVHDFHARPVGLVNITKTEKSDAAFSAHDVVMIRDQFESVTSADVETERFHVYGINHKFNYDLTPKKNFKKCWAIPLLPTFGADGWIHTCFDMRGRPDLKLCKHFPEPSELRRIWNTDHHKKVLSRINVDKCPRCTFTVYNQAVEQAIINDNMCRYFP